MSAFNNPVDKKSNNIITTNNDEEVIHKDSIIRKRKKVIYIIFLLGTFALIISGLLKIFYTNSQKEGIIQIITSILAAVYMWYLLKASNYKKGGNGNNP